MAAVLRQSRGPITPADASRVLGTTRSETSRQLARWAAQGWLTRVRRGLYIPIPIEASTTDIAIEDTWVVAAKLFSPCYIGGWSAASHWELTEQLFRETLVFSTRRPRARTVDAPGASFKIRTIRSDAMFGLKAVWRGKSKVNVSDPTRTILDILDAPAVGGGIRAAIDVIGAYLRSTHRDPVLLVQYADRLNNRAVFKRMGFLAETFFPDERQLIADCRKRLSTGIANLDPAQPNARLIKRWRLRVPPGLQESTSRD